MRQHFLLAALALACAFLAAAQTCAPAPAGSYCFDTSKAIDPAGIAPRGWPSSPPADAGSWVKAPPLGVAPPDLAAALAAAKPGDTIRLGSGPFPFASISNRPFSPPLTITSADPAHPALLNGLRLSGVSGVIVDGVDVHLVAPVTADDPVINVQNSSNVLIRHARISGAIDKATGALFGKGVVSNTNTNFTLADSEIFDAFKGVNVSAGTDTSIVRNDLHHIRTSPINGGGLIVRALIDGNHIHDIVPIGTDHSDGIHFFTKTGPAVTDLTISNNLLEMATAFNGTLGINLEGTPAPGGFINVKVTGNTLRWNNNQGITTNYIVSGEFTGNVLTPLPGLDDPKHAPTFVFRGDDALHIIVTGNTAKDSPSLKPFRANSFLTAAQITAMGAAVRP